MEVEYGACYVLSEKGYKGPKLIRSIFRQLFKPATDIIRSYCSRCFSNPQNFDDFFLHPQRDSIFDLIVGHLYQKSI
jgi:hypothetical protein